jgi:hypothetical protein
VRRRAAPSLDFDAKAPRRQGTKKTKENLELRNSGKEKPDGKILGFFMSS